MALPVAMLLIFSMRAADVGVLLFSAWLDLFLQPPHCPIKDWRYSLAAQVCDCILRFMLCSMSCVVKGDRSGGCVGRKEERFEPLLLIADALRRQFS